MGMSGKIARLPGKFKRFLRLTAGRQLVIT